ncbi:hypothetical protein [Demequina flava]|uniref:hypothetical protein n=1 Tax=Demequina flava TaxID=1095025 RepID=UPI00078445B8|nr:hypothetical protein [Demequina flava]
MTPTTVVKASDLLPLTGPPARIILVLFVTTNAALALGTLDHVVRPWQAMLAVAFVSAAGVLIVRDRPYPFPLMDTLAVLACLAAGSLAVFTNLQPHDDLGRATWQLGSSTWALFFLTMRGRIGFAWLGMGIMMLQSIEWAARSGRGALSGAMLVDTHIGILVVGTLFAVSLKRTAEKITDFNQRAIVAAGEGAAASAAAQIRRTRADELAQLVSPLLTRITAGKDLSEEERSEMARAEARLRDGVRGHAIALPPIVDAAEQARMRGVGVTLLDDRGDPVHDGDALGRMVAAVVLTLDNADSGDVTVRLGPGGRASALTIRASQGEDVYRLTLGEDGYPIER